MTLDFSQLIVLIGVITTNIVIIITAFKSHKDTALNHQENKEVLTKIEDQTNSHLTSLEERLEHATALIKKLENLLANKK